MRVDQKYTSSLLCRCLIPYRRKTACFIRKRSWIDPLADRLLHALRRVVASEEVVLQPTRDLDTHVAQNVRAVTRPAEGHHAIADRILHEQIPSDDPRDDLSEGGVGISVGTATDRYRRCKFGVAQSGKETSDCRQKEEQHDRGPPLAAALPIVEKIPAPMMAATPKQTKSNKPRLRVRPLPCDSWLSERSSWIC